MFNGFHHSNRTSVFWRALGSFLRGDPNATGCVTKNVSRRAASKMRSRNYVAFSATDDTSRPAFAVFRVRHQAFAEIFTVSTRLRFASGENVLAVVWLPGGGFLHVSPFRGRSYIPSMCQNPKTTIDLHFGSPKWDLRDFFQCGFGDGPVRRNRYRDSQWPLFRALSSTRP